MSTFLKSRKTKGHRFSLKQRLQQLKKSEAGVSAIEFALIAPIMAFGLVATADVALAVHERMTIDHVLRAGAQAAMADPGEAQVLKVVQSTLGQSAAPEAGVEASVKRYCACPENADVAPGDAPACAATACASSAPQNVYYRLEASKTYQSMSLPEFLPDLRLGSSLQVQVR